MDSSKSKAERWLQLSNNRELVHQKKVKELNEKISLLSIENNSLKSRLEELENELQAMKSAEVKVQVPSEQSIPNADSEIVIDSIQTSEAEYVPDIVTQPTELAKRS